MNILGAKHANQMNAINYLTKDKGGRGLRSLEDTYTANKLKLATKLLQETDHRFDLVKEFHKANMEASSFSIFKDAPRYASEIGLLLSITGNVAEIKNDTNGEILKEDLNTVARTVKEEQLTIHDIEVTNSTW